MDNEFLGEIITEIFDEYTVFDASFGKVYFKHFDQLGSRRIFSRKSTYQKEALSKGMKKEKESINLLIDDGVWTTDKEDEINAIKTQIKGLEDVMHKIQLPSQREEHKKLIDKEKEKLSKLNRDRKFLIGMTAESYAQEKVHRDFFDSITFLDPEFKIKTMEEISYEEKDKEREIVMYQNQFFEKFSDENISKAVLSPFYASFLPFSENTLNIFGKPLKDMTSFQIKMAAYGRSFLNIFKTAQKEIPEYVAKDPELLLEWHNAQKNQAEHKGKGKSGSGGSAIFGATDADLEAISKEDEKAVKLSDAIHAKGGNLNMQQMMELHGV